MAEATMAPAETVAETKTKVDRDSLIENEVANVEAWYREGGGMRPGGSVKDFVKRVYDRHARLIEHWGGWHYHCKPFDHMPLSASDIQQTVLNVANSFVTGATLYAKNKAKAPEKLPPLKMRHWNSEAEELYCKLLNCCLPLPVSTPELWRDRVFTPDDGAKEKLIEYASTRRVKVRAGQAPTRAVLAEVRKTFKDHPNYVLMWERIAEALGVAWAGSRGVPISFTCAPSWFLRLGHMGEGGSCYATNGGYEHSKLNLSMMTDSVVCTYYHKFLDAPIAGGRPHGEIRGRCWGVLDLDNQGAIFSNSYNLTFASVDASLEQALKQMFGWEVRAKFEAIEARNEIQEIAYVNGDFHAFSVPTRRKALDLSIADRAEYVRKHCRAAAFECQSCGTRHGDDDAITECQACGHGICTNCEVSPACCEGYYCERCADISTCEGCDETACSQCGSDWYTEDGDCYCPKCAEKFETCTFEGCERKSPHLQRCAIDPEHKFCPTHTKLWLRTCTRCSMRVHRSHVTRCSGCKQRRCDNCLGEGETKVSRSLCGVCQASGVEPVPPPTNEEMTEAAQVIVGFHDDILRMSQIEVDNTDDWVLYRADCDCNGLVRRLDETENEN